MIRRVINRLGVADWFVVATLPCALIGIWNTGRLLREAAGGVSVSPVNAILLDLTAGAAAFLPALLVALATSYLWGLAFALARRRPLDPAWFMSAWLFSLLLPHGVPLIGIAAGVSFGVIFGQYVFGGTGKYLVSPALLGVLFLRLAYPGWFDAVAWLPDVISWQPMFIGLEKNAFGTPSELACLLGAAVLFFSGVASWRIIAGAVAGAVAMAWLMGSPLVWYGQLLLGQFAFCVVFIATDPSVAAVSRPGRWLYGGLIGALTVMLRIADPSHPEGTLLACLFGALFAPLIDVLVVRAQVFRYQRGALP